MSTLKKAMLLVLLLAFTGCGAAQSLILYHTDRAAWFRQYGPVLVRAMDDPNSDLNTVRSIARRFPAYYAPLICDAHGGCWVPN